MSIQEDFAQYKTVERYLCPNPIPAGTARGCDNQLMFTSEYVIMLAYNGIRDSKITQKYISLVSKCMDEKRYLHRAPDDPEIDLSPDDHYGVYAALVVLDAQLSVPLPIILWRQPQLLLLKYAAEGYIPLPLRVISPIAALIIALSCRGVPTGDTDSRRLSWLLIQGLSPHSWLCRQAAKIWYKRLYRDYAAGMKNVAAIYYQPQGIGQNPYAKHWVTEKPC